ncbi:ROK family protein [Microbacterium sp. MEC084]|jgi:polyphosphate glucokinase|uniref:polyphosphate--glucose phosphotransferase n=1 Tax=unclassified Microbacterium TaxID=2609290 RepID=UPI0006FFC1F3|nr:MULTISPECIES: ROK family protein [unclassified Microbacterium]KQZ07889.1 polyphosphate glucokinase [Microbacterium sp. Root53]MCD1267264.1 ROK family protein [Microbacterium sp. MEC084]
MANSVDRAVGIDIGGTGMKAGIVDLGKGELVSDRVRIPTPKGAKPKDVLATVTELIELLGPDAEELPVGICFPTIVKHGRTMSASNVSKKWIDFEAEKFFEEGLGRSIHFVNDADAAGLAELRFGGAKDQPGLTILTTLGTGIGSAFLFEGALVPNTELGHLQWNGEKIEAYAAPTAREREDLSWEDWAGRLQEFYDHVEFLFSPDLILVGGGVSKNPEKFMPLLKTRAPMRTATHLNNAGIIGAASLAL